MTTVAELRDRLVKASLTDTLSDEEAANTSLAVLGVWLLERIAAERVKKPHIGRCPCGRATLVSERSGRITAYGMIYDEIVLLTEGAS